MKISSDGSRYGSRSERLTSPLAADGAIVSSLSPRPSSLRTAFGLTTEVSWRKVLFRERTLAVELPPSYLGAYSVRPVRRRYRDVWRTNPQTYGRFEM